jgi:hypothetical protein
MVKTPLDERLPERQERQINITSLIKGEEVNYDFRRSRGRTRHEGLLRKSKYERGEAFVELPGH